jgi:hypothetical protein
MFIGPMRYLVGGINKPLSCLYQHEPQPGQLTNYVLQIFLFIEKNLLEPLYISGIYLSLPRVLSITKRPIPSSSSYCLR